ncbi:MULTISPECIES: hypothetical protein [Streptomyces]|uniref:hypothetical protein n=1 Tax=Streptomyces TaxID=1883 RepID=UPI000F7888FF|nr:MULTISPECIES: hypothetical protein [Streptomyces]RST08768.1 hypothetical protein EF910_00540 [Streptomyces sp. WAC07149]GLX19786.1 hypothetical protein Slala01_34300 [Streptomyces lavendulae subsp. lavendulae]GLX27282.1 hypothetical protein Slala02_31020 [Streptomyces lavendulae subsp. lavendulae]
MESTTTYAWPRWAEAADGEALERWLAGHGWEVDPMVFMAGGLGQAVQVRPIGSAPDGSAPDGPDPDGEAGLLILPGETVEFAGTRIRIARRIPAATGVRA